MDNKFYKVILAAGFCMAVSPAFAQEVSPCPDYGFPIGAIAEPWEENTRSFSNGSVRITKIAYEDPAIAPIHLALLYPLVDAMPMEGPRCVAINGEFGGFYDLDFGSLEASYDPAIGLIFRFSAEVYDADKEAPRAVLLEIALNQSTDVVTVRYR